MRSLFLLSVAALGVFSISASAGPFRSRVYSTCQASYSYTPYYAPAYYSSYTPAYTAPVAYPAPTVVSTDWRSEIVKYASSLKEIEAFNQAMGIINPGYVANATYYGGQGQTLYGAQPAYSVKATTVQETNGINLELADQRSARFNDSLRETLGQANGLRQDTIAQSIEGNARVAEIQAKAQSAALAMQQAAILLQSANAAPSTKTTTTYSGSGTGQTVAQPAAVQVDPSRAAFMKNFGRPDCARCHSAGPTLKGGFDIETLPSLNRSQAAAVWSRITSDDPAKVMPKPEPGKPVVHLPADHLMQWAAFLSQAQ